MRISLVNGFFLPLPPLGGGATEKSWHRLAQEFAARGHEVRAFSRTWPELPATETVAGVTHHRLPGFDHTPTLAGNILRDLVWSWRVHRSLPPADIVVCNAVTLPVWLGRTKPAAGRVVLMAGRMPKGQYRHYRAIARILAPSSPVAARIVAENPALAGTIRVTGYPNDSALLADPQPAPTFLPPAAPGTVTLGFVGRIHEEKGLRLLADALARVRLLDGLPPWRVVVCGPSDVARGGSGSDFRRDLIRRFAAATGNRAVFLEPQFNDRTLAALYQRLDIFCYPSLAEEGETFGVAVVEAMAAGAVPVVSGLECFRDFVRDGVNGAVFDHAAADAPERLAAALGRLLRDAPERARLVVAARAEAQRFDFPRFADDLLADFARLTGG
jgi:glycosyltransferase involved in cell wall biosynthesis